MNTKENQKIWIEKIHKNLILRGRSENTFINYNDQYVLSYVYVAVAGFIGVIVYFALAVYFDLITALFGVNLSLKQLKKRILRRR